MKTFAVFAGIFLAAVAFSAQAQETDKNDIAAQYHALHWVHGPKAVHIGLRANLQVPAGYKFLASVDAKKFEELTHNIPEENEYIVSPEKGSWFGVFHFDDIGYVKDTKTIDADEVLATVKRGTEEGNKERKARGWATMSVTGWRFPPRYDKVNKRLEWAIDARDSTGEITTNYNTRILGRNGAMSVVLVADPKQLDAAVVDLKTLLNGFTYVPDQAYGAYREGDKIAEYGLAGLITGGAVAVAAKSGILMKFWKLIVIGFVAVIGVIKRLFGRGKKAAVPKPE